MRHTDEVLVVFVIGVIVVAFAYALIAPARTSYYSREQPVSNLERQCSLKWPLKKERYESCLKGNDTYAGQLK